MPWLLRNSFRFRLYNTSWRGTRFHFRGNVGELLSGFPPEWVSDPDHALHHGAIHASATEAYQHENSWFGRTQCSFHARAGQFYAIYLLLLVAMVGFFS